MTKQKQILSLAGIVLILGASLFFRERISDFLNFGSSEQPSAETVENLNEEKQNPDTQESEEKKPGQSSSKIPAYTGRDPAEYRPVPEEVKVFNEDQKTRLFASIQTHASVVKADPAYFNGWIQIGILKKIIGDFAGARDAWEYASVIEPGNSLSFANLGELYWRYLHDYPKSEQNLKTSIKHKPDDVQTYVTLAELYHYSYKEKADLADDVLLEGIRAMDHETLLRRLAYLYEQRNELPKALEWWEKVLLRSPDDTELKAKIDSLKSKIGGAAPQ